MSELDLSVVVPVYNNAATLDELIDRLLRVLDPMPLSFELIFVDDGSRDAEFLPEPELANERKVADLIDLFDVNEMKGATRVAYVAKIAKARNIPLQLDGGKLPDPSYMPESLVDALIEELSKSK